MGNTTKEVWDILLNDISIRKDLSRGIINVRALAKFIKKTNGLSTGIDGIISAIRRFEKDVEETASFTTITRALAGAKVTTKTNMVCVTLNENSQNIRHLHAFLEDETVRKEGASRILKGEETMKIMFHESELKTFRELVKKEAVFSVEQNLAEIDIYLAREAWECKGLIARIANEIANYDVNIIEVITVLPEALFFVRERDLINAHQAVLSLVSPKNTAKE